MNRRTLLATLSGAALQLQAQKRDMIIHNSRQEGYEMPLAGFKDYITPVEHFFVRSHHLTPKIELDAWKLEVKGHVNGGLTLSMADLKAMKPVEMVAVLECAGNGRGFYEPSMPGLQWEHGSVGNARWRGVRLADVLKRVGVKPGAKHVLFDGADVPVGAQPEFQRTIPIDKAMDPNTLLAFDMNGAALPASHGFPLRVIAPGWAGDSWVKWVTRIEVLDKEFDGFFMKTGYRHPGKGMQPGLPVKPEEMKPVEAIQVKSVIAAIGPKVSGAAWAGEKAVATVEVSVDRGRTWKAAKITSPRTPFGWVTWEYDWQPPTGYYVVMARAHDTWGHTQPMAQEWNPSGYQWNAIHQVASESAPVPTAPAIEPPAVYKATCVGCHDEGPVRKQRLSRAQWEAEVGKMQRWGAPVKPETKDELLNYLVSRFGYRHR
ncbi:MAG: molybdopterin-dependent oxidoreductase [Acidobacteria bacterium]|nr:molybdopterin-dependent oxidoreductase [Acidobacteriota bacterium]